MNDLETYLYQKTDKDGVGNNYKDFYRKCSGSIKSLLIFPPITIPSSIQKRCIPPVGILFIASYLKSVGHDVQVIDCCMEGYEEEVVDGVFTTYGLTKNSFYKRLSELDFKPDVVGMSVPFSIDLENCVQYMSVVKKVFPTCITVFGGLHPTIYPGDIRAADVGGDVDFVIRGEGEYRFAQLVNDLSDGKVDTNMDGFVALDGSFSNHERERIEDLDSLPYIQYDLLPIEKYFNINVPFSPVPRGDRVLPILTSRGCPFGCSFCASTNMYKTYYARSPENVVKEVRELIDKYNIDEIQFVDDNLLLKTDRFREIIHGLKDLGIWWCTPNGVMINNLTSDFIKEMSESGLYQITLSVDSATANTLKNIQHKKVDLNRIPELIKASKECGVFTHGTVVVGMLDETIDDIRSGLDYVLENFHFTSISTFIASPIPGSELYHQAISMGLVKDKRDMWKTNTSSYQFGTMIDEGALEDLVRDFQLKFTKKARELDPDAYERKYRKLIERGLMNSHETIRLT